MRTSFFCIISGRCPDINYQLDDPLSIGSLFNTSYVFPYSVCEVLENYRDDDEDLAVIGAISEDGGSLFDNDTVPTEEALNVPNTDIRVISGCRVGTYDLWIQGYTYYPDEDMIYHTAFGTNIMVYTSSLRILSLATDGRMNPVRLWRLAMKKGLSLPYNQYGLDGIDYGEVQPYMTNSPSIVPGMLEEELDDLEEADDAKEVEKTLISQGKYWVWMDPELFPNPEDCSDVSFTPTLLEPPTSTPQSLSKIENLPLELLHFIVCACTLASFCNVASTSRYLRAKLLRFESDRNLIAKTWIMVNAPYWMLAHPQDEDENVGVFDACRMQSLGWDYLRCYAESGSMRNRKRIWAIAEQLEKMADDMDV